jgi:hypothetical protein
MNTSAFKVLLAAALLGAGVAHAQVKQTRTVGSFRAVHTGGGIDVRLKQGPTAAVVVDADADTLPKVRAEVEGGVLKIGWVQDNSWRNMFNNRGNVVVYVTCPELRGVSVSGGSDARGESSFSAEAFDVSASGGGDIKLTVNTKNLKSHASGGSDITLAGRADRQRVSVSGGSDYHAYNLQSSVAEVSASGGSDAELAVESELTSEASGGCSVRYRGNARVVSSHASGGSSVRRVQ